jgi:hypothetical protein
MAVSVDDLLTPFAADGSDVRNDLTTIAGYLGWTVSKTPGDPTYQLVDFMGRWGTKLWNSYAIPALRAQFGRYATGNWATLLWRSRGTDRNLATFASGPVMLENRDGSFHDVSAVGAVQLSYGGNTYTSQGPAPGFTGTMAAWAGGTANYATTTLIFQADVVGTSANVPANAFAGYPAAPASAPPAVYVGSGLYTGDTVAHAALQASDLETDDALLQRGRAAAALAAPSSPLARFYAVALGTMLPTTPPVPVATNRVRVIGSNATVNVYLANPSGPSAGNTSTPGTDLYEIDARLQRLCGSPGITIVTQAAAEIAVNAGTVTLYVTAQSNVTVAAATATAEAAIDQWVSTLPIGGKRKVANGQGYFFAAELAKIAQSELQAYDAYALGEAYLPNATINSNGSAYYTVKGGTSASTGSGPIGTSPPLDGTVTWVYIGPAGTGYAQAPGVFDVDLGGLVDVAVAPGQVVVLTYTINVVIVDQGT